MEIFERNESNVRSYCRSFPVIFTKAKGALMTAESGNEYIDFFAGAGALNYGHNNEYIKHKVLAYLASDSIIHALDMHTTAKRDFIEKYLEVVLKPRNLDYKMQFCGPTGTNAVEAALKLARKVKKRSGIFSFFGAYHGMSMGSLAATSNLDARAAAGTPLNNVTFMPYPHGFMQSFDGIEYMETILSDDHSGIEKPAAIIFETVQADGGVVVAPVEWMQRLRALCDKHDILLICDEVQVGCNRTGPYFSFERANIVPDIVVVSKSISGYGFPMSLVLMKRELDVWEAGEHTGTFRGHQLAFIGASAALDYLTDNHLEESVYEKAYYLQAFLNEEIASLSTKIKVRGLGMIWGIDVGELGGKRFAKQLIKRCFELGLIIESAGRDDAVLKILPPLTIDQRLLEKGCMIIRQAFMDCMSVKQVEMLITLEEGH